MTSRHWAWLSGIFASLVLVLALGALTISCAGNKAPVLVGQSGLAIAQSIGQIQQAVRTLSETNVITPPVALQIQERLLKINDQLKPLPEVLRTIDRLQVAGSATASDVDKAIAILQAVGQDVSIVTSGVPVTEFTDQFTKAIRAAQAAVQTTLIEVAKLKGGQ